VYAETTVTLESAAIVIEHLKRAFGAGLNRRGGLRRSIDQLPLGVTISIAAEAASRTKAPWEVIDILARTLGEMARSEGTDPSLPEAMIMAQRSGIYATSEKDREFLIDHCARMRKASPSPMLRCMWRLAELATSAPSPGSDTGSADEFGKELANASFEFAEALGALNPEAPRALERALRSVAEEVRHG